MILLQQIIEVFTRLMGNIVANRLVYSSWIGTMPLVPLIDFVYIYQDGARFLLALCLLGGHFWDAQLTKETLKHHQSVPLSVFSYDENVEALLRLHVPQGNDDARQTLFRLLRNVL